MPPGARVRVRETFVPADPLIRVVTLETALARGPDLTTPASSNPSIETMRSPAFTPHKSAGPLFRARVISATLLSGCAFYYCKKCTTAFAAHITKRWLRKKPQWAGVWRQGGTRTPAECSRSGAMWSKTACRLTRSLRSWWRFGSDECTP